MLAPVTTGVATCFKDRMDDLSYDIKNRGVFVSRGLALAPTLIRRLEILIVNGFKNWRDSFFHNSQKPYQKIATQPTRKQTIGISQIQTVDIGPPIGGNV